MTVNGVCWICGAQCPDYKITCSDECHEKLVYELENMLGRYKKVTDIDSGKSYKVPLREIIEYGLKGSDLKKYPEWKDGDSNLVK